MAAASAPYGVDATEIRLTIGDTHQLTASKLANGKDVPAGSISWSSSDETVASVSSTGLVTAVASGEAVVSASRGVHRETVTVIVDGCVVTPLAAGSTAAEITTDDCVYAFNPARRADYYSVATAPAEVVEFRFTGFAGTLGFKEATSDPRAGAFYGAVGVGVPMRVISNGGSLQAFVAANPGVVGAYTIERTAPAEPFQCGSAHVFRPGVSFAANLTATNSCRAYVQYPMIPEAQGKPLDLHYFNMVVEAGRTYTVTITGVSDTFNPALTVFGGAGVLAQAGPDGNAAPASRTVSFTPSAAGYVGIEVASGRFNGGLQPEHWVIEHGAYTMSVSQ